jgi:hypothetical protein
MIQAGFTAIAHATLGYMVDVGRFWYLPTLWLRRLGECPLHT